jgi:hypothetical protein
VQLLAGSVVAVMHQNETVPVHLWDFVLEIYQLRQILKQEALLPRWWLTRQLDAN